MTSAPTRLSDVASTANDRPTALVLDAHLKSSLAAIRSLGSKGIHVIAGADHRTAMGLCSRYAGETFVYPSPLKERERFLDCLSRQSERSAEPMVLYCFSDATFIPLYEARSRFDRLMSDYPEAESSVRTAYNKVETLKLATRVGVEIPDSYFPGELAEVDELAAGWRFPAVVKPLRSTAWRKAGGQLLGPSFAFSVEEVKAACEELARDSGAFPMIQEYISGEELGAEFLCHDGEVLAAFAHRRLRSGSPVGGAAVVKQAIPESYKSIGEAGRCLLRELRWSGPAMIEFKVDNRDGRAKLMEINGRFWGSLPLAVMAGVDFPWLYFCQVTGTALPAASPYREGMVSRHLVGDAGHLARVLFSRNPMRTLAFPKRSVALRDFFFPGHAVRCDIARLDDPVPAGMELLDSLWKLRKRRFAWAPPHGSPSGRSQSKLKLVDHVSPK